MSRRKFWRHSRPNFWWLVTTLAFGAVPATILCFWPLLMIMLVAVTEDKNLAVLVPLIWGVAGLYGTYALWMVAFGFRSPIIFAGLLAGLIALAPFLLTRLVQLPLWDFQDGIGRETVLATITCIVLIGWVARLSCVIRRCGG